MLETAGEPIELACFGERDPAPGQWTD